MHIIDKPKVVLSTVSKGLLTLRKLGRRIRPTRCEYQPKAKASSTHVRLIPTPTVVFYVNNITNLLWFITTAAKKAVHRQNSCIWRMGVRESP